MTINKCTKLGDFSTATTAPLTDDCLAFGRVVGGRVKLVNLSIGFAGDTVAGLMLGFHACTS